MTDGPRLGSWARGGGITGLVTRIDDDEIALFEPGERRIAAVARAEVEQMPAAAVRITITGDLPLPHGVGEETLRRWAAALTDPLLRDRASAALEDAGQDVGPALPEMEVELLPAEGDDALCLCGARTPSPDQQPVACRVCGRQAVTPPS
jgi:hypothetical protein